MNHKIYPFKLLAAYERKDDPFYFGRERERNELYQKTFETDLIVIYGLSGVGKTSLIQCGLASKFKQHDWLDIYIRRGSYINDSLIEALNKQIKNESDEEQIHTYKDTNDVEELIRRLYNLCYTPIYLIFDQFEELYISGKKIEAEIFYATIRKILSLNQPVKIIISIRQEYFGHLYYFEKEIPQLLSHKYWVQPKPLKEEDLRKEKFIIDEIFKGVIAKKSESNVHIENESALSESIKKLFEVNNPEETIDLPSLQILFHEFRLFINRSNGRNFDSDEVTVFSADKFEVFLNEKKNKNAKDILDVKDIVWEYLESLIDDKLKGAKSEGKKVEPNIVWWFLLELITVSGTKKSMSVTDLKKNLEGYDNSVSEIDDITKIFGKNDEENANTLLNSVTQGDEILWELRHDALAKCIREKLDPEIRLRYLIKEKVNLNSSQIEEIKDKKDKKKRLLLSKNEEEWVKKCERRIKIQKWGYRIGFAVILCLLIVAVYGWLEANKARDLAKNNEKNAAVELYKRYQSELKDLEKRVMIIKEAELDPQVIDKEKNIIENEISKIKDKIPDIEQIIEKKEVIK